MPAILVMFPTGHKARIEVEPNKPLRKALESACSRRSLDPTKHILVHNRRPIDLSSTFRFSGLVNNASVELVATDTPGITLDSPAEVRICIKLNDGQRAVWSGHPHCSLWDILNQLAVNTPQIAQLLSTSDDSCDQCLAVVYLHEQVVGTDKLKSTTPADLGVLCGSALFQLKSATPPKTSTHCVTSETGTFEEPLCSTPANVTVQSQMDTQNVTTNVCAVSESWGPEVSDVANTVHAPACTPMTGIISPYSIFEERPTESMFGQSEQPKVIEHTPQTLGELLGITLEPTGNLMDYTPPPQPDFPLNEFKFPSETAGRDLRSQFFEGSSHQFNKQVDRQLVPFRQPPPTAIPSTSTEDDLPDEFFEHTVNDLRSMLQHCRSEWAFSEPLQTAAMRHAARERMYRKYPRAIIHFHWSDGIVLQGCFEPLEQVSSLYDFVRQQLRDPHSEFQLYTTPPKVVLKSRTASLIEANLVPMAKVYFSGVSTKGEDTISQEVLSNATTENIVIAEQIIHSWMNSLPGCHHGGDPNLSEKHSNDPSSGGLPHAGPTAPPKW